METQETLDTPRNLYNNETTAGPGQSAIERLQALSSQRAAYNAVMMRKAEDRYNEYMAEMRRRYEEAHRSRPWWKKMLGGMVGGAVTGGISGLMMSGGNPIGGAIGAGAGMMGGGTMGALGAGGESGMGGMMPMMGQMGMMGAMGMANVAPPTQFAPVAGPGASGNITGLGVSGGAYNMPNYLSPLGQFNWPQ